LAADAGSCDACGVVVLLTRAHRFIGVDGEIRDTDPNLIGKGVTSCTVDALVVVKAAPSRLHLSRAHTILSIAVKSRVALSAEFTAGVFVSPHTGALDTSAVDAVVCFVAVLPRV
jgi:hypothetical protein